MTRDEIIDGIYECLLKQENLACLEFKQYDPILKQVDLYCDPSLSLADILKVERDLQDDVWSKLTTVIFRKEINTCEKSKQLENKPPEESNTPD